MLSDCYNFVSSFQDGRFLWLKNELCSRWFFLGRGLLFKGMHRPDCMRICIGKSIHLVRREIQESVKIRREEFAQPGFRLKTHSISSRPGLNLETGRKNQLVKPSIRNLTLASLAGSLYLGWIIIYR